MKNSPSSFSLSRTLRYITLCLAGGWLLHAPLRAQTWDGGGTDNNWSTGLNWSTDSIPTAGPVLFNNTDKTSSSTVNNIVDQNFTLDALTFNNTGSTSTDWQYMQINSGITLTLDASTAPSTILTVGGLDGNTSGTSSITTRVKISGAGSLVINEPTSNVLIGNYDNLASGGAATGELDLSGLASFTATVANFSIGQGNRSVGLLTLGTSSTITASVLSVGYSASLNPNTSSILNLGSTTNLNVANIYIGAPTSSGNNVSSGILRFNPSLAGGDTETVVIRGQTGGSSRANLTVGQNSNDGSSPAARSVTGLADFTGGSVDALLDTLLIAYSEGNTSNASLTGTLSMNQGTIDASSVIVGRTGASSTSTAPTATGNLNVSGGTFTAGSIVLAYNSGGAQTVAGNLNISGTGTVYATTGITMGRRSATAGAITATVDITGGSLVSGGNISEHTENTNVSSALKLRGGTMDLGGHDISVDTFTVESGTLKNLHQLNSGGTLTKTTSGTLIIEGTNAYTGNTLVNAGNVQVNGTLTTSSIIVASQASVSGSGSIGGSLTINAGGTLSPGTGTTAVLTSGSLSLASGANVIIRLNGSTSGSGYDALNVAGTVNLNSNLGAGSDLVLTLGFAPTAGQTFTLITNDGSDAIEGMFATINGVAFGAGNTFSLTYNSTSYDFQLFYNKEGTSLVNGNDLLIVAVPEPAGRLLATLGLSLILLGRRIGWRKKLLL